MTQEIAQGTTLAGRYRVDQVLGVGSVTAVVAATDQQTGRPVAIKMMLPEAISNAEKKERLEREALILPSVAGDNVVQFLDAGHLSSGVPYLVMELLQGETLQRKLEREHRLGLEEAVWIALQVCAGLAPCHGKRIFHRDLCVTNIFLVSGSSGLPKVKIINFGAATAAKRGMGLSLTGTDDVIGAIHYMSPEQMMSSKYVDQRGDIWSIGVLLYEMLTGSLPFDADGLPRVCEMILTAVPAAPRSLRPDLPGPIDGLILACLAKNPNERPDDLRQFVARLQSFGPSGSEAIVASIAASPPVPKADSHPPSVEGERPRRKRLVVPRWAIVAGAIMLIVDVILAVILLR